MAHHITLRYDAFDVAAGVCNDHRAYAFFGKDARHLGDPRRWLCGNDIAALGFEDM